MGHLLADPHNATANSEEVTVDEAASISAGDTRSCRAEAEPKKSADAIQPIIAMPNS